MTQIWKDLPISKSSWAFYYFCKRRGDTVRVIKKARTMDIIVIQTRRTP